MLDKGILDVLSPYNFWGMPLDTGVLRASYVERIHNVLSAPSVIASVTGVRRAGKTFICLQALKKYIESGFKREQTLYINLEDPTFAQFGSWEFLNDLYETFRFYKNKEDTLIIVLDEVQNIAGWEKWVRMMLDRRENVRIIVTGSSSKIQSDELGTKLTGRYISIKVSPLSYADFLRYIDYPDDQLILPGNLLKNLETYLQGGGFPVAVRIGDWNTRRDYLKDLFDAIISKDVVQRYKLRNEHEVKAVAAFVFQSMSSMVSVPRITNSMNGARFPISSATVNQYLQHLHEAFLFYYVPIFSYKVKDHMLYAKKTYCVDTGLANAVSFKVSDNWGCLAENVVAMELIGRYGQENIFYWKDTTGKEVDFVVVLDGHVEHLIEVAWLLDDDKTKKREISACTKAMEELGKDEALILTRDKDEAMKVNGKAVRMMPLVEWLLEKRNAAPR